MIDQALLKQKAASIGVDLGDVQLHAFDCYVKELSAFNEHTNLVSRTDLPDVVDKHIIDSLSLLPLLASSNKPVRLIDIGSGAGFPALILAIASTDIEVTLVEAVGKKCRFLEEVAGKLNILDRVAVLNERAEELAQQKTWREKFDCATARAVGTIDLIAELCLPFLKVGGILLAQKSVSQLQEEKNRYEKALRILGGQAVETVDTNSAQRKLAVLVIKKKKPTADTYPRQFAKIKQRPLGLG